MPKKLPLGLQDFRGIMKDALLVALLSLTSSCSPDELQETDSYLIFGHFYGKCLGEQCVETFKLTDTQLFEDSRDDFTGTEFSFDRLLGDALFQEVKDLRDALPKELLQSPSGTFGCPNCADQGGLLVQYVEKGSVKTWRIDLFKAQVPTYLHAFVDKVNEKIERINR